MLLEAVVERTLQRDFRSFDLTTLRSRSLLRLEWEDGSAWDAWVIVLPSGLKLYCDSTDDEDRVLASGGRNEGDESDRAFLELLADSAGGHFGIEMSGGAPSRVRSAIRDREFLVELFVNLFEVAGREDSVREQIARTTPNLRGRPEGGRDFRTDVEQLARSGAPLLRRHPDGSPGSSARSLGLDFPAHPIRVEGAGEDARHGRPFRNHRDAEHNFLLIDGPLRLDFPYRPSYVPVIFSPLFERQTGRPVPSRARQ